MIIDDPVPPVVPVVDWCSLELVSELQRRKIYVMSTGWGPAECPRCKHDLHRCPGCGEDIPHGATACAECAQGETP